MVRGKLAIYVDKCSQSGCTTHIEVKDHPLNSNLGLLVTEVVCGARKRDRKKVLLSAGAKEVLKEVLEELKGGIRKEVKTDSIVEVIEREGKIPKMIIVHEDTKDVILLGVFGSGFRGTINVNAENNAKVLVETYACQAWGCATIIIAHLPVNSRVIAERTGRLYGREPYLVIMNVDGELRAIYVDSLDELEADQ